MKDKINEWIRLAGGGRCMQGRGRGEAGERVKAGVHAGAGRGEGGQGKGSIYIKKVCIVSDRNYVRKTKG